MLVLAGSSCYTLSEPDTFSDRLRLNPDASGHGRQAKGVAGNGNASRVWKGDGYGRTFHAMPGHPRLSGAPF